MINDRRRFVLVLVMAGLCGCDRAPTVDDGDAAKSAGDSVPDTGKVIQISAQEPVGAVHPGDILEWPISNSSPSVESGTEWSAPTVAGDAVVYVLTVPDSSVMPGGSPVNTHRFRAMKPGKSTLRSTASSFGSATPAVLGEDAPIDATPADLVIEIEVSRP